MRPHMVALAFVLVPSVADAAQRCRKGIPCGNTCISATKTCRVGPGTATRASEPPPSRPERSTRSEAPRERTSSPVSEASLAPASGDSVVVTKGPDGVATVTIPRASVEGIASARAEQTRVALLLGYPQVPFNTSAPFVGWTGGRVFMLRTCPSLRAIAVDERVTFRTEQHATSAGYVRSPAPDC
jgi:hypothetical protein